MSNVRTVIDEAREQFLVASIGNVCAEGIAIETRTGIILGGMSSETYGFIGATEALQLLTFSNTSDSPDDLTPEFEIASIAIAVREGRQPNQASLIKLANYIGTQDGQLVTVISINNAQQISETRTLKL